MPRCIIPPGTLAASKIVTAYPSSAKSCAADMPAGPDPMIAIFSGRVTRGFSAKTSTGFRDSGPCRSVTNRFNARIEIGKSNCPRRHADSHGCPHTRPQIDAKGFGTRAYRYASSYLPSAIKETYRPACVWTGHACMQGKFDSSHSRSTSFVRLFKSSLEPLCAFTSSQSIRPLASRP